MGDRPKRFREDRTLQGLAAFYSVIFALTAISPADRATWLLENLVVFVFVALVVGGFQRWRFSTTSYVSITLFLTLHSLGAHFTYAQFPPGLWVQELMGLERNPFDRVVHFSFGLLMAEPCRELVRHYVKVRPRWGRLLAVPFVISVSAVFEVIEAWAVRLFGDAASAQFLATQGDPWDSQKDITMAAYGALVWLAFRTWVRRPQGDDAKRSND
jgi:putative membrane protein